MKNFPGPDRVRVTRWLKFAVLTALFFTATGYLFISGMKSSMVFYLTLEDLSRDPPRMGQGIRLAGQVKKGTISGSLPGDGISFVMTDGERELPVRYQGQVPDSFRDQGEVIVEGIFRRQPVFEAAVILPRCPSRYRASEHTTGQETGR